jgi:energy-converting hydrogenase Eha subunit A
MFKLTTDGNVLEARTEPAACAARCTALRFIDLMFTISISSTAASVFSLACPPYTAWERGTGRPCVEAVPRANCCAPAVSRASLLQPFSPSSPSVSYTCRMSEPAPESKPASVPEPAEDPWRVAFLEFKTRDEKMVKDYQEEIDTLLVVVRRPHPFFTFGLTNLTSQAGLFSAVLTAFVVESYQSLQEDYTQTSAELLRQISRQLANSSIPAAPDSSQFQAQQSDVRVNACWFVSLLLSLVVALFGIFLKQWMRTYMTWTDVTPDRAAVAIRQVRYRGLETWRLGTILTVLPTLLQLSVILFLSGLLVFLWNLDRMVAHVMAVLLAITFSLVAAVTALPAVFKSCPFRSPLSEILAVPFWRVAQYADFGGSAVWAFIRSGLKYSSGSWRWREVAYRWRCRSKTPTSWVKVDEGVIARYNRSSDHVSMHASAMVHLCHTTQSQPLWSAAIAAITAEDLQTCEVPDNIYWNEVWWPVLGHIFRFTEKQLKLSAESAHLRVCFTIKSLSSPTKDCWLRFLLQSKTRVCRSDSSPLVQSYMACCLGSIKSTTGGPYMQAFMEVLKAHFGKLQGSKLDDIAHYFVWEVSQNVLLASLSGWSFPERILVWFEHTLQTSSFLKV